MDLTNLPVIGKLADIAYDVWSENRLRLTGRGELADVVRERAQVSSITHYVSYSPNESVGRIRGSGSYQHILLTRPSLHVPS